MKNPEEIRTILDQHEQKREHSCFQSAVEMILKLRGIISLQSYPEQDIAANDGRGYEPFAGVTKNYGKTTVTFEEIKFDPLANAIDVGRKFLDQDIYPVFSFMWPNGSGYHGFVGFRNEVNDISFFTKNQLGHCPAARYNLIELIFPQKKTEILVMRVKAEDAAKAASQDDAT